ncbi:MAG: DUF456 domain-containing protein [Syntrophomonadaceae bacterium]|nr:DUF456 domain-containing protein [Syntrophomonadaceae bacterium]
MPFDILITVIAVILVLVGFAGTILPLLPGIPLIFLAIAGYGWYEGFKAITVEYLLVMAGLTVLSVIVDYISSVLGARYFGSSKKGIWGALLGTFIGIFLFPPVGILLGPWLGAVIGEYFEQHDINKAMKVGIGTVVGLFSGMIFKIMVGLVMTASFLVMLFN